MNTIGIDIGGTKIAGALVSADGQIIAEERVPTPVNEPTALVDAVVSLINKLRTGHEVAAAGIAMAGFIDAAQSLSLIHI